MGVGRMTNFELDNLILKVASQTVELESQRNAIDLLKRRLANAIDEIKGLRGDHYRPQLNYLMGDAGMAHAQAELRRVRDDL
jgi:hypothetical protein